MSLKFKQGDFLAVITPGTGLWGKTRIYVHMVGDGCYYVKESIHASGGCLKFYQRRIESTYTIAPSPSLIWKKLND